ncbi:MAG: AmmeMemoRadiSam system protein A [bacterium]|nr:AmmeMemoRadiSam system protein A [bacterium]
MLTKLPGLARWTLEQWLAGEDWEIGGPGLTADEDLPIDGLFVTLRINRRLRGCIGTVERQPSLDRTLRDLTLSAAINDPRFPPLTADELPGVHISLSILTPPELIEDLSAVEIGKHGLIIERGSQRGLFLPEVATEWGWDLEEYLAELCQKAGLPRETWRQPGCTFYTFESIKAAESED